MYTNEVQKKEKRNSRGSGPCSVVRFHVVGGFASRRWAAWVALPVRLPPFADVGCVRCHWIALLPHSPPFVFMGPCMSSFGRLFASLHQSGVSHLGVGLPASLRAALPRCSSPFVGVSVRTSALGCRRRCGLLYFGVGSSFFDVGGPYLIVWPFILVVGASSWLLGRSFFFVRARVVVVMSLPRRLGRSLLARLDTLAFGKRGVSGVEYKGRQKTSHDESHGSFSWRTVWASHFLGPPLGPPLGSSFPYPSVEGKRAGPHPYGEGRGTGCELRGRGALLVVVGRRMNQDQPLMRLILN